MQIHQDGLSDIDRYISRRRNIRLESKHGDFEIIMKRIATFKDIHPNSEFLEIGIGTGWFPILCRKRGISCKGIEISPQLVEFAHQFGRLNNVEPDIELGNIEDADIGRSRYDVIIASSTFEHVERWRLGLEKVYTALKPGGCSILNPRTSSAQNPPNTDSPCTDGCQTAGGTACAYHGRAMTS